jgi:hypothetical protein
MGVISRKLKPTTRKGHLEIESGCPFAEELDRHDHLDLLLVAQDGDSEMKFGIRIAECGLRIE